jgi:hypothetical protein
LERDYDVEGYLINFMTAMCLLTNEKAEVCAGLSETQTPILYAAIEENLLNPDYMCSLYSTCTSPEIEKLNFTEWAEEVLNETKALEPKLQGFNETINFG